MNKFESFQILTSGSIAVIIFGVLALTAFAYYVYRYTIPKVSVSLRTLLIVIRSLILLLLLIMIFEPVLSLSYRHSRETKTFVFIDNSSSIAVQDSSKRREEVLAFLNKIESNSGIKTKIFPFDSKIDSLNDNDENKVNFIGQRTNFSQLIDLIQKRSNEINSAVILSDGILTDGVDPSYQAEKLQVPLFTIGIGDSTTKKDISIQSVFYNRYIYADRPTAIEVAVKNTGYEGKNTRLTLFEEGKPVDSKDVTLSDIGLNKIAFNYKPSGGGEKKLSVTALPLPGESSTANNTSVFYINVLDSKLKVCLIAGSPSEDVSAISEALGTDKNISLKKIIQISPTKFWNDNKPALIDSSEILFLVDFPSASTPQPLIDKVSAAINDQGKPFFIMVTNRVNFAKLNSLDKALPFSVGRVTSDFVQIQPELLSDAFASNFSTDNNSAAIWNNLPPVIQMNAQFMTKIGTSVLVQSKVRNIPISNPLIVARSLGKQRSFAILAGDVWRWQLQTAEKNPNFFVNFIDDIVKWLNVSSQKKQFTVTTDKKTYSPGEQVNFTAELYDRTFNAIDTSKIEMQMSLNDKKFNLLFTPMGNGIYSSAFTPNEAGNYRFEATAHFNGASIKSEVGRFSVGDVQIEKLDTQMRPEFLKTLAKSANGEYYSIDNYTSLMDKLSEINRSPVKETITKNEYRLWSNEWLLITVIILFAAEWFLRKRSGML